MHDSIPVFCGDREVARALVSPQDYLRLSQFRWGVHHGYVLRRQRINGKTVLFRMHREVLPVPEDKMVDHINGNRLDNRRENLREATAAQNIRNSKRGSRNKTGFKGVCMGTVPLSAPYWRANIRIHERQTHLGNFPSPEEAARAYDSAAHYYFGEFARLNFPNEVPAPFDPATLPVKGSQYIGVSRKRDRWRALLLHEGKQVCFGVFDTELEAALAYNEGALRLRGEAARLNQF